MHSDVVDVSKMTATRTGLPGRGSAMSTSALLWKTA